MRGQPLKGRETATPGQRKAAAYIEDYFKSLGLKPGNKDSFQLAYPVYQDSLIIRSLQINGDTFQLNKDFDIPDLPMPILFHLDSSNIVFAGYGISDSLRDDYKGLDVAGKIVMVLE